MKSSIEESGAGTWLGTALAVFGLSLLASGVSRIILIVLASSMLMCSFFLRLAPKLDNQRTQSIEANLRKVKLTHISLFAGLFGLGIWLLTHQQPLGGAALVITSPFALYWNQYKELPYILWNGAKKLTSYFRNLRKRTKQDKNEVQV